MYAQNDKTPYAPAAHPEPPSDDQPHTPPSVAARVCLVWLNRAATADANAGNFASELRDGRARPRRLVLIVFVRPGCAPSAPCAEEAAGVWRMPAYYALSCSVCVACPALARLFMMKEADQIFQAYLACGRRMMIRRALAVWFVVTRSWMMVLQTPVR